MKTYEEEYPLTRPNGGPHVVIPGDRRALLRLENLPHWKVVEIKSWGFPRVTIITKSFDPSERAAAANAIEQVLALSRARLRNVFLEFFVCVFALVASCFVPPAWTLAWILLSAWTLFRALTHLFFNS